jgi:glutathione synthase/RimK-type ligase-like ATP-grasp enzyme
VTTVALVTSADLPDLDKDDRPLIAALAERQVTAVAAIWDDPAVNWAAFDLAVIRSTWDYAPRRDEFTDWARTVARLENPAETLRWNTDKRYLRELESAGVPVIPTVWLDPARHLSKRAVDTRMPAFGDFVVKPVVSAGAKDTGRYQPVDARSRFQAIAHTMRLLDTGRWAMIQPYVTSVDSQGETCLMYVDGDFQHAIRVNAVLTGPLRPAVPAMGLGLYPKETMVAVTASAQQRAIAERALAVASDVLHLDRPLLYARVDLVDGADGPLVIELELTEPSLRMAYSGSNPTMSAFADAIAARARG